MKWALEQLIALALIVGMICIGYGLIYWGGRAAWWIWHWAAYLLTTSREERNDTEPNHYNR